MTPQSKWAAETGLDPDDYSVWDNDQSSQRAKAHRWAFARADEYCPEEIHIVMNRNCGCAQLVKGHEVATLDVDEEGFPTATWYGAVRPGCLSCVRMGELDQSWFDRNPERRPDLAERYREAAVRFGRALAGDGYGAYVLDLCLIDGEVSIVELNGMMNAGLFALDMDALTRAMRARPDRFVPVSSDDLLAGRDACSAPV